MKTRRLTTIGAWATGCGLAFAATVRLFNLEWETYIAARDLGLLVAGIGVAAVLYGLANHMGVGGLGAGLCAVACGGAVTSGFTDVPPIWPVILLALLSVGVPLLVRAVAERTRAVTPAGQFGSVALGALGVSLTAEIAGSALGEVSEGINGALNVAMVLSLLAAVMAAGMAVASRAGDGPVPASAPTGPPTAPTVDEETGQLHTDGSTPPLSHYQRLTLLAAIAGTVVSALISVVGSVLAALVTGEGS